MGVFFGSTEITGMHFGEQEITEIFFGDTEIFSVWAEYDGALPAQYSANGSVLADYRIYGSAGGVGDESGTAYGYTIDMSVSSNNLVDCEGTWTPYYAPTASSNGDNQTGSLTLTGRYYAFQCIKVKPNTTYTFSGRCSNYDTQRGYACFGAHNGVPDTTDTIFVRFISDYDISFNTGNRDEISLHLYSGVDTEGTSIYTTLQLSEGAINNFTPYSNITTPIYIGDTPLGEDEYVDYGEGKIYRKKQVHTDTVTIDGIVWDILGYDHDTVYKSDNTLAQHSVTIQAHDVLSDMQFDAKEALFAFDNGLAAGTYHFTVGAQPWYRGDVNKTIQFTLSSALPAGGQMVINNAYNATMIGATISAFASGTATTATEIVMMSEGSSGADLGTVTNGLSQDGVINSIQRALLGSNNWQISAMRQYLNSSASAGSVWFPQTKWDRPPAWAANTAGFLNGMSAEFVTSLGATSKTTALNTVTDGGGTEKTLDRVFLLSRSEVYAGDETTGGEGAAYSYYSDFSDLSVPGTGADNNRIKYRGGNANFYWLRSPDVGYTNIVRLIYPAGTLNYSYAMSSLGVAPACCIVLDDMETNDWLREKFLKPVDPPVPLPALPTVDGTTIVDYAGQSVAVPSRFAAKYRKEGF